MEKTQSEPALPLLLKPTRFAKLADISRSKAYELIKAGAVRSILLGGRCIRVPASELQRLAEQGDAR